MAGRTSRGTGPGGAEGAGPAGAVDPRARGLLPPVVLGLEDCPGEQAQKVMTWDYTCAGHLGVAGSAGSGRSTLLRGIAAEVARTTSPEEVHVYGIDAGTGALLPCTRLPHVGAVVTRDQPERLRRLLDLLGREVTRRQQLLALDGLASVAEQRLAAGPQEHLPYLLLLIDRWDSYVASFESVDGGALVERVELLLREGGAVGLHVVMAGDQTVCRGRMGMMLEDRLALRLPAAENYDMVGMRPRDVPVSMPSGRAFRAGARPREVQVGLLDASPAGTAQVAAVHALARQAGQQWSQVPRSRCPRHVDELPVAISLTQALALSPPPGRGSFCLAVGGDDLGLLPLRMEEVGNGVLVTGPRRSGRSTALYVGALTALDAGAQVVAVAPGRSPLRCLQGRPGVLGVLGEDAVAADLLGLIRHAPPRSFSSWTTSSSWAPTTSSPRCWRSTSRPAATRPGACWSPAVSTRSRGCTVAWWGKSARTAPACSWPPGPPTTAATSPPGCRARWGPRSPWGAGSWSPRTGGPGSRSPTRGRKGPHHAIPSCPGARTCPQPDVWR